MKAKSIKEINLESEYKSWLFKSEPESRIEKGVDMKFGIDDLKKEPNGIACWDGVRNYSARNWMRRMKVDQRGFFYHSNTKVPGIVGLVNVVKEAYPDHTHPTWDMVDVQYVRHLKRYIPLPKLKELHLNHKSKGNGPLSGLALFTKARLSVQPLTEEEFDFIIDLENDESLDIL
ncbi:Thymocyte nuclear protein 1 [Lepeophtheirus salmonis]|uniref:Thymocyte nuclear protein 1 n=1 Tax=Lepeophtheirus salmonis TaxID=72036 RepID=A0A7R8CCV2_LEPSM|nr:Thymocyte nuclear protein 1 [Lepeophtheirus salmonis]CAF2774849.1 Thymocyte nuclear protein 1 [Lepeophtheirus salmonis]